MKSLASLAIVAAFAITLTVGGGTARAAGPCSVSSPAYPTIQSAVNDPNCNPINVAAGTYLEPASGPLTINRTVTLLGAQAGADARTRVGSESVVTDPQGTIVTASDVVIDGFTFQDSVNQTFTGFGIDLSPVVSGTQILNNIIQNNIVGIGLANAGPSQALIRHNLIQNNNVPGPASGQGIYTDQYVGGTIVQNVLVVENAFKSHDVAGIDVSNTDATGGVFGLDVSANCFDLNGRAVLYFNTHDSTVHDNRVTNSTAAVSAAVRILDNNTNLTILRNDLVNGLGSAIKLTDTLTVGGPSSGVLIHQNNIGVTGSANFALDGLLVDPLSHVGTVNAESNWWGSATGPFALSNLSGTGEEVVGNADFTPWLTAPAPGGLCIGGVRIPSTGKGTGGGQVPVPGPAGASANFGFNAQVKAGVSSGHFEFNERGGLAHHCDVTLVTAVTTNTIDFDVSCNTGLGHVRAEDDQKQGSGAGADKLLFTQGTTTKGGTLIHGQVTVHN